MLVPQTSCGEYHVLNLRLNRPTRLALRLKRNEFAAHLAEAQVLIKRLEESAAVVSYPETTDELVVIARIRREIELLQAELTVAIPFIPLWDSD